MLSFTPLLALTGLACSTPSEPRPPDMVLVLVDTLRADALGVAGSSYDATPNLDALAASEATWFSRAYSSSSWTLASTATLFTGKPTWEHRVIRDTAERPHCYGRLPAHEPNLASRWKQKGYRTGAWINNAFLAPEFGLAAGFDVYDFEGAALTGHRTASTTVQAALTWLDQAPDQPALMVVHLMEPHADYDPGPPFAGTFTEGLSASITAPVGENLHVGWMSGMLPPPSEEDQEFVRAAYAEEVLATDAAIGELIAGLQARGRWEDTRFVVTADHGEEFWDQGRYEHGHRLNSSVTQVPLVLKAPGVPAGRNDSVVDAPRAAEFLHTGEGWLLDRATLGDLDAESTAISEDILYGPQEVSLVTRDHRIVLGLEHKRATAWLLEESGYEQAEDLGESQEAIELVNLAVPLVQAARGSLRPARPIDPTPVASADVFQMLRELGYVDAGVRQQAPCQ
jgi:hypothetical protein